MKKKGNDLICMRPDSIVEARFSLTSRQNDVLDMVFATIENDDNLVYEIDLNKYAKLYNLKNQSVIYHETKKAVKSFEGKGFSIIEKIDETKENREYFAWFSRIKYCDGEGKIIVELGQTLKKLLIEVKRAVFYKLEYSINFKSIYSKRLYYYLKLYQDTGIRIDMVDILREKLECPKGYKNFADFNRNVLRPAYEEINGNSDITYEYEPIKEGRKITKIKFHIKYNKKLNDPKPKKVKKIENEVAADEEPKVETFEDHIAIINKFTQGEFNEKTITLFLKISGGNLDLIRKRFDYMNTKNINKNRAGYMITILKNFEEPKQSSSNSGFNNFTPRETEDRFTYLRNQKLSGQTTEEEDIEFEELLKYR